jgi:cysteine desulfurase
MQATSPTDPRVLDAMIPYMTELYGNPHSRTHKYGWETEQAVEKAREVINHIEYYENKKSIERLTG